MSCTQCEINKQAVSRVQAAYRMLEQGFQLRTQYLESQSAKFHEAISTLESEREANAILTAEIEVLRKLVRQQKEIIAGILRG